MCCVQEVREVECALKGLSCASLLVVSPVLCTVSSLLGGGVFLSLLASLELESLTPSCLPSPVLHPQSISSEHKATCWPTSMG